MAIWRWLLNPAGLTAHGFCLSWSPGLIALHAGSDAVIGLAYLSIPLALIAIARRRTDLKYSWLLYLFVGFIVACGFTHLMSIVTLWMPLYGVEGLVKLVTALLSVVTAVTLWPLIPRLVALPSAAHLEELNSTLARTVADQAGTAVLLRNSEARVRAANSELELRVTEQTAELRDANMQLTQALEERTAALHAQAVSERQFRASFEGAAVGKVLSEPGTARIVAVNRSFARMLGYEPEELVGRLAWELTWPDDRAPDLAEYDRFIAGDVPVYVREKRYLRRDGQPLWGRVSATIVQYSDTGRPALIASVVEDYDKRYKAEAELRASKERLEVAVAERTNALQQRDILLREVYHRVKNNLQIIDSLLVMQGRNLRDPDARNALQSLRARVHALGLVHHQLMGSANLRTFDVAPFLDELTGNLIASSAEQAVRLSVHAIPLDVGLDFAIPLGLLVTELVTNSLKHAFAESGGCIDVVLEHGEHQQIVLIVSDDGRWQVERARSPDGSKRGLGATIIAGLVDQLGGVMTQETSNGTRTEIRLAAPGKS